MAAAAEEGEEAMKGATTPVHHHLETSPTHGEPNGSLNKTAIFSSTPRTGSELSNIPVLAAKGKHMEHPMMAAMEVANTAVPQVQEATSTPVLNTNSIKAVAATPWALKEEALPPRNRFMKRRRSLAAMDGWALPWVQQPA